MGRIKMIDRLILVFLVTCFFSTSSAHAESPNLLFIGNSYTYGNDLDQMTATLLQNAGPTWENTVSTRHAAGGAKFFQHLAEADGTQGDTALRGYLEGPAFFAVMLQEQSQIPGFPQANELYTQSSAAFMGLNNLVAVNGGHTMALMTWGRRTGDSQNAFRYPDFKTMQGHLKDGYFQYARAASTTERPVMVIPAGLAFEKIYDDIAATGQDPLSDASLFWQLYSGDGSHPSLHGTYLTACVIYASLTGETLEGISWAPEGIDEINRSLLQSAANFAVFSAEPAENAPRLMVPAEQPEEPQDPTAPDESTDPAAPDVNEVDASDQENTSDESGLDSSTTPQPQEPPAAPEPDSSGCSAFPHFAFSGLIAVLFFLRRRARS
jgi:hypothetical protein